MVMNNPIAFKDLKRVCNTFDYTPNNFFYFYDEYIEKGEKIKWLYEN